MRIALISPAGAPVQIPSLALTKLKGMLDQDFESRMVTSELIYLNFEFWQYLREGEMSFMPREIDNGFMEFVFSFIALNKLINEDELSAKLQYVFRLDRINGNKVIKKIIELPYFIDSLIGKYNLDKFDLIGVTTLFSILPAIALINVLKKKKPNIKIVLGGTMVYKEQGVAWVKENSFIDYIVSGPGMISFKELVQALLNNEINNTEKIKGVLTKNNFNDIEITGEDIDINKEPMLDFSSYIHDFYKFGVNKFFKPRILLELSRGCRWGKCRFCNHYKFDLNNQMQDNNIVISRINEMFNKYGDISIHITDAYLLKNTLKNILPKLNTNDARSILFHTKTNLDEEVFQLMSEAHVPIFEGGVESLSTNILKLMDKGSTAFQNLKMLKLCMKFGILPSWNYLYGVPGMTDEIYLQAISDLPKFYHFFPPRAHTLISFIRWSKYWENPQEYGLHLTPHPIYKTIIQNKSDEFINDIALGFIDTDTSQTGVPQLLKKYLPKLSSILNEWQNKWKTSVIDEIPKLQLFQKSDRRFIYDSRFAMPEEYEITDENAQILKFLENPSSMDDLYNNFSEAKENMENIISSLYSKKLLFLENGKYLNLVSLDPNEKFYNLYIKEKKDNQIAI